MGDSNSDGSRDRLATPTSCWTEHLDHLQTKVCDDQLHILEELDLAVAMEFATSFPPIAIAIISPIINATIINAIPVSPLLFI
jgi:hypothetical protein